MKASVCGAESSDLAEGGIAGGDFDPPRDCALCPRLAAFRHENRQTHPDFFNAPVPAFAPSAASLAEGLAAVRVLVVGLAPGLKGANRTGRPFTGDYAGDLLYPTLAAHGFATGAYGADPGDGFRLQACRITNAVRCVPPENKPTTAEIKACRPYLVAELKALPALQAVLALGQVAHNAVLAALGLKQAAYKFGHGAWHSLPSGLTLVDSYHCSRYNTNTGRLTAAMFSAVIARLQDIYGFPAPGPSPL